MKNVKKRWELFPFYDHSGMEKQLERMAAKGWLLEKLTNRAWVYRRAEPVKRHYAVTYYPKASAFDPEPQEGELTYRDYGERGGWHFVCSSAQLQVFCSEAEDPVPMETDPLSELQGIRRVARKLLPVYAVLSVPALLGIAFSAADAVRDPIGFLADPVKQAALLGWLLLLALCAVELCGYFSWRRKAQRAAECGAFPETRCCLPVRRLLMIAAVLAAVFCMIGAASSGNRRVTAAYGLAVLLAVTLMTAVRAVSLLLKSKKASRGVNLTVTLAADILLTLALLAGCACCLRKAGDAGLFDPKAREEESGEASILYRKELPLSVRDLSETDNGSFRTDRQSSGSLLLGRLAVQQRPEEAQTDRVLMYTLTLVKRPGLYDFCRNSLLRSFEKEGTGLREVDAAPWGAEEAYAAERQAGELYRYLLCYEDRFLVISFGREPAEVQKTTVMRKLGGKSY